MNPSVFAAATINATSAVLHTQIPKVLGYADQAAKEKTAVFDAFTGGKDVTEINSGFGGAPPGSKGLFNEYSRMQGYGRYSDPGQFEIVDGMEDGVENLAQATIILVVGVAIIISNIIVLVTFVTMPGKLGAQYSHLHLILRYIILLLFY